MNSKKIRKFMQLAGQELTNEFSAGTVQQRKLGAALLLSEVLEYCIKGLGVIPVVDGHEISKPDGLTYLVKKDANKLEMLDGLADVAYTMYWNASAFGIPLEEGFELVCDNNLEKFVELKDWSSGLGPIESAKWHCNQGVSWPQEVVTVDVVKVENSYYAVGKDSSGKVRKPSSYKSVDLNALVA